MKEFDRLDLKIRNISLIIILISIILLVFWAISYINSPETASPLLMSIGVALLLAGILLLTRIQYLIWMKKRY
ncbi:MAG: hypothetical protein HWN81_23570 [Candidatus Lokiarchaeota archaeon]|nr:hypothetical protein [Candidatus Lokiarchaeota archaeon]